MNYIWNVIVNAKVEGIDLNKIRFKFAQEYSPYLELSNEDLNDYYFEEENDVEVNPYYRFLNIFKDLFPVDHHDDLELREVLLDIVLHFLSSIDVNQGMDKREYYKRFFYNDIKSGLFGEEVKRGIKYFDVREKNILLDNLYKFYINNNHLHYLKDTIRGIFLNSNVYLNKDNKDEVLVYIDDFKSEENIVKLKTIEMLFLPIDFEVVRYWKNHFGIIGLDRTMRIGSIVVYSQENA